MHKLFRNEENEEKHVNFSCLRLTCVLFIHLAASRCHTMKSNSDIAALDIEAIHLYMYNAQHEHGHHIPNPSCSKGAIQQGCSCFAVLHSMEAHHLHM